MAATEADALIMKLIGVHFPFLCLIVGACPQWKEQARAAESEVQRLHSHIAHMEHAARAQEVTLEQLKGRLGDKVTKEERVARRDAEAYARLKRAFLSSKGPPAHIYCLICG